MKNESEKKTPPAPKIPWYKKLAGTAADVAGQVLGTWFENRG